MHPKKRDGIDLKNECFTLSKFGAFWRKKAPFSRQMSTVQVSKQCAVKNKDTPFENPQRWMGQNTFPILLLNDDSMIGEH